MGGRILTYKYKKKILLKKNLLKNKLGNKTVNRMKCENMKNG